jgi:hypothetical protein
MRINKKGREQITEFSSPGFGKPADAYIAGSGSLKEAIPATDTQVKSKQKSRREQSGEPGPV